MSWFFGLHNYSKPGRGISKDEPAKTGIALYLDILLRRFWNIITLNLIYIIFSIPAIVISFFLSTFLISWSATVSGVDINGVLGDALSLVGILFAVIIVFALGSGPASAGMTFVLRNYVNDKHAWAWGDFYDQFKSNFKQGIVVYIINIIFTVSCIIGFVFYTHIMTGIIAVILRSFIVVLTLIFALMQMYIYQLMSWFKLSVKKIYKYSAILAIVKLPLNLFALAISAFLMYLLYELMLVYPAIAVVVLLLLSFTMIAYTQIFITNNVIKEFLLQDKN